MLHEINGCDPVLRMPCGRNVSLWVGGLSVKADFVPKIDIVGLVPCIALLGRWQRTLVFEDDLGVYLVRPEISLARRYALQTY
jgi:hypothetical protein